MERGPANPGDMRGPIRESGGMLLSIWGSFEKYQTGSEIAPPSVDTTGITELAAVWRHLHSVRRSNHGLLVAGSSRLRVSLGNEMWVGA